MSRHFNRDDLFVDTELLRDHVSKLREKKKIATKLYENVRGMRRSDEPENAYRYNSLLREIEQLIEYFDRMAAYLSDMSDDAVELSRKMGNLIEENTEYTRYIISDNYML